jgi:hypothetical protein
MIGAPNSVLGSDQSAWRQGWLINDTSVWVELTYDTPVYMTSIQIRQVYNIGSIHKIEVFTNGGFTTVWGRHIDTGANIQGGTITGEVTGKKSDVLITLTNMLEYPVQKVRVNIGSTTATWDGIDSVQLTGKTLVSAELPARTDTAISYNNLKDKPTIPTLPPEITDAQVTSGVGTDEVLLTPTKLKTAITTHAPAGGGGATLPPEITDTQVTSGTGTTTVLVTPAKAKAMIVAHAPAGVETFETILNNHRSWNIRRIYSDAGVLTNIGFRKTIDGTEKRIIVTYSYNTNGSINNIDLVGELPASVDTRKHHSYNDAGMISEITYSTPTP